MAARRMESKNKHMRRIEQTRGYAVRMGDPRYVFNMGGGNKNLVICTFWSSTIFRIFDTFDGGGMFRRVFDI